MARSISAERRVRRARRHRRVTKKLRGTAERPRLVVFRSLRNVEGQLVDDDRGATLLGVSTLASDTEGAAEDVEGMGAKVAASYLAGRRLALGASGAEVHHRLVRRLERPRGGHGPGGPGRPGAGRSRGVVRGRG